MMTRRKAEAMGQSGRASAQSRMSPFVSDELAAALNQNVPNELRAVLLDVVNDLRLHHPVPARRAYWQTVRQYLGG